MTKAKKRAEDHIKLINETIEGCKSKTKLTDAEAEI